MNASGTYSYKDENNNSITWKTSGGTYILDLKVEWTFLYGYKHTYTLDIKKPTISLDTGDHVSVLEEPIVIINKQIIPRQNNESVTYNIMLYAPKEDLYKIASKKLNETLQKYHEGNIEVLSSTKFGSVIAPKVFRWSSDLKAYEAQLTCTEQKNSTTYIITYKFDIYKGEWLGIGQESLGDTLRPTIARWYYAIRNFVLVVMMVILLYIGIRIILSGVSSEKAKYKNMLVDWFVAICLVFVMHYIMSFAMNIVEGITDVFSTLINEAKYVNYYEINDEIEEELKNALMNDFSIDINNLYVIKGGEVVETENGKLLAWDAGNMVGVARIQAALCESGNVTYIGFAVAFLVLVFYTGFFLFTYMKRALYLTFFTIIAPLVAMTYPIDKIHDGKAQAFNMWLKEYIFNLMIQPIHLLLYTILISSAFGMSVNIIYTLVAIGFMMPAEKFLRKMFGFDKAQTPGFLSGAAGAALAVTGMNKLFNMRHGKGGGSYKEDDDKLGDKNTVKRYRKTDSSLLLNSAGSGAGGKAAAATVASQLAGGKKTFRVKSRRKAQISGNNTAGQTKAAAGADAKNAEKEKKGFFKRHWGALKSASKSYSKAKLTRAARNIKSGKTIRNIARTAGGAYLGLGGALIGATMGVASGDLKNVGQYAGTLGAGGYALGSRDLGSDSDAGDAYEEYQKALADSPEEYELEKQRREFLENEDNLTNIKDIFGLDSNAEARQLLEEYGDCIDAGIYDIDDLATIISLDRAGKMNKETGTVVAQYYNKAGGRPENMDINSKEYKHIKHICENVARENGRTELEDINASVNEIFTKLNTYGSAKDKLRQI